MLTYNELRTTVMNTGIWADGRQASHGFVLSPDVFRMPHADARCLAGLGQAVNGCLLGVSRLMAIAADSSLAGRNGGYQYLNRLLGRGSLYGLGASIKPGSLPVLRKVDIVPGADGKLWIAEIDATNPRSWGYSLVGRALCRAIAPDAPTMDGVVPFLVGQLKRRKVQELTFLYGHTQRFYAPEFEVLARELLGYGIILNVCDEVDITIADGQPVITKTGQVLPPFFVDFPPMNQNKPLIDWLVAATKARAVDFLVPPKHFLGSKMVLAVLSNAAGNKVLERLLLTQIDAADLATVRRHLPATFVVDDNLPEPPEGTVLKKAVSSGMHGVFFSGSDGFDAQLAAAKKTPGQFVLQRLVTPAPFGFRAYNRAGELTDPQDWFVRLTAYLSYRGVEDVAVTARTDVRVHGAKDAIVTGTVIV